MSERLAQILAEYQGAINSAARSAADAAADAKRQELIEAKEPGCPEG